jgi:hypothetical protein
VPRKLPGPALLSTLALAILAIWELAVMAGSARHAPTDEDWRDAVKIVDAGWREGDLVVFAPDWIDPLGRLWFGKHLSLDDAGRMDIAGYPRIWEVSIRGAHDAELDGLKTDADYPVGPLRVRHFLQDPAPHTWRAHAGAPLVEVDFHPRRCMRLSGSRTFPQVPLGGRLVVRAGLADVWARKENEAYARVTVAIDGKPVGEQSIGNDTGWSLIADVPVTDGRHDVSLTTAIDPARGDPSHARTEVCVAAEGRTPPMVLK